MYAEPTPKRKRAVMSTLPIELIAEILSWLPVKSLLRFKCVHRTWDSEISDPKFAKLQVSRATVSHRLLLTTRRPQSVDYEAFRMRNLNYPALLSTNDSKDRFSFTIVGSCDGLICLLDMKKRQLLIWNPTTGNYSRIPDPSSALYCLFLCSGVGYNRSNGDYEVLFANDYTANGTEDTVAELYNLRTRTWKRIEASESVLYSLYTIEGICQNGDLYYLTVEKCAYNVVCFDMVEERFKQILTLPYRGPSIRNASLGMHKNNLCVYVFHSRTKFECLELKMEGDKVSFGTVFKCPHATFPGSDYYTLCMTRRGEVVMCRGGKDICWYDPKRDRCNERFWLPHDVLVEVELYRESLVSPDP